jgi:DNA-binding response OmpR family regulator
MTYKPFGASCPGAPASSDFPSSSPCVLVVDDDDGIRALLDLSLRRHGFAVLLASIGQEGLEIYQRCREKISVVLLDVQMPGLDGPKTLAALRVINPDLRCCFMSGDTGKYTEGELRQCGAAHVFRKPFRIQEVADVLHQILRDPQRPLTSHEEAPLSAAPPAQQQRKSPRLEGKPVGVLLAGDEAATQPVHGVVVNHSPEGLCVLVEHATGPGTILYVRPAEPDQPAGTNRSAGGDPALQHAVSAFRTASVDRRGEVA